MEEVDDDNVSGADGPPRQNTKHQDLFMSVFDIQDEMQSKIYNPMEAKIYTNQTGRFPVRSIRGHQYIIVLLNMDSLYIGMEPIKNRHSSELVKTYQILIDRLKACGINPKYYVLDNECSDEFKETIKDNKRTYQLVLADDHRRIIAERVI